MSYFTIGLINEVRKRPMLWNRNHDQYNNRILTGMEWDKLADFFGSERESMKQRWRNLRDQFRRELRKVKLPPDASGPLISYYKGKWVYFEKLVFLRSSGFFENDKNITQNADPLDISGQIKKEKIEEVEEVLGQDTDTLDEEIPSDEQVDIYDWRQNDIQTHERNNKAGESEESSSKRKVAELQGSTSKRRSVECSECSSKRDDILDEEILSDKQVDVYDWRYDLIDLNDRKVGVNICKETSKSSDEMEKCTSENDSDEAELSDIDEDEHFAESIVPFMRKLDPIRKQEIKGEIKNMLLREFCVKNSN